MLTEERFKAVCAETAWHVKKPLDLIFIHAEKEVRGRQPRATLNPFTVLAAAAAWERFLSDLAGAVKYPDHTWGETGKSGLGRFQIPKKKRDDGKGLISLPWEPAHLNSYLRRQGVLGGDLSDGWAAWLSSSWVGSSPKGWSFAEYANDPDAFHIVLKEAQRIRNGAAHLALPQDVDGAQKSDYTWTNNAESVTIQNGHARGVTAVILQLLDASIVTIARDHGWSANGYRLPAAWFQAAVPATDSRYPEAEFWGGGALHRVV
ncbi:hypothetical protein [Streptomyces sp. NPDC057909]|uniref:hypothetical protein n=1 Tax=Streptomyces sp. NPDC057909 TaxID=3346277 RepID=UPI0036E3C259